MKIYLVGGAVRDKLLGLPVKEQDWVVVGATVEEMLKLGYRQVGKEFPVFLHPKTNEEYALARMERKVKPGYQGFTFDTSPAVSLEEDLLRRDLTINAMAVDQETQQLVDPYGGQKDLTLKLLRHVSPAFIEDPVRILRVGRFLARYSHLGFHLAPETVDLMSKMVELGEVDALVAERVWKEFERALEEKNPEQFFHVLAECKALPILFPHMCIDGPGIKALQAAAGLTPQGDIRFAALLHGLLEQHTAINALCDRYRAPNAYRELALLTALHYQVALAATSLSSSDLIDLLYKLDFFRRKERFQHFLIASLAIAQSQGKPFDPDYLKGCAYAAAAYNVQELVEQGLTGIELAEKLKEKRCEKITEWLHHHNTRF